MASWTNLPRGQMVAGVVVVYMLGVAYLRRQRRLFLEQLCQEAVDNHKKNLKKQPAQELDENKTATIWRANSILTANELRFESVFSISCRGLFLTYSIPSISNVLTKTGGFQRDMKRRYADMEILLREVSENAVDGTTAFDAQPFRSRTALQRLNAIHGKYAHMIEHRDMMYVLSVFMCTGASWCDSRWSWRKMTKAEKEVYYWHWVCVGEIMNLDVRKYFSCFDEVLEYKLAFEAKYVNYTPNNAAVSHATIEYFVTGNITPILQPAVRLFMHALMSCLQRDPAHAKALGLPKTDGLTPWLPLRIFLDVFLTTRALFTRYLLPPRSLTSFRNLRKTGLKGEVALDSNGCPMTHLIYYPNLPLDHGNKTYTKRKDENDKNAKGYRIEHLGPKSVKPGSLVEKPLYKGHAEGLII
eukprot:m.342081 g.342081  ORF g.342081 m.342081 type:complete len:414 (+) comp20885_c0_seq1:340-1581(+)